MDNTDSVKIFVDDAIKNGITILPPDVNQSGFRFVPVDRKQVRYGLGAVKGTGEGAINCILAARESGGAVQRSVRFLPPGGQAHRQPARDRGAGALRRLRHAASRNRNAALMSVGLAMEWAENQHANAAQNSLFGDIDAQTPPDLVKAAEWALKERLIQEKAALGLYLSGHPFDADRAALKGLVDRALKDVKPQRELQLMAGTIASVRTQMTRRGKMASIMLDDRSAQIEIAVFNELFDANRQLLKEDALLIVAGKAQRRQLFRRHARHRRRSDGHRHRAHPLRHRPETGFAGRRRCPTSDRSADRLQGRQWLRR